MSDEYCHEKNDGYFCPLVLDHECDHTAQSGMDGVVYATLSREKPKEVSDRLCLDMSESGVYWCNLLLGHDGDHETLAEHGFVCASWPQKKEVVAPSKVDYDPLSLSCTERYWVDQLEFLVDEITKDLDQEGACKILYHYDLQRKRLDIIQATPPSRRT